MDERINLTAVHPRTGVQGSSLQFVIRLTPGFRVGWLSAGRPKLLLLFPMKMTGSDSRPAICTIEGGKCDEPDELGAPHVDGGGADTVFPVALLVIAVRSAAPRFSTSASQSSRLTTSPSL